MERLTASRLRAIGESLRRLDLVTAQAVIRHADWLGEAERVLREANIQLAAPIRTASTDALRARIDALLDVVPRPLSLDAE